jgi:hypothetical protein
LFIHPVTEAYMLIYVDDLLMAAISLAIIDEMSNKLGHKYPMESLGDVAYFLSCHIIRDRSVCKVWIVQDAYVEQLAQRFKIEYKKRLKPTKDGVKLRPPTDEGYTARKRFK